MFNSSQNRRYLWHTQTHIGRNTCRDVLNVSKRTKTHWKSINARKNKKRDWVCPTRVWSCIWHVISTGRKQYKRIDLANSPVGGRTDRIIQCMAFMSLCTYVCTSIYTCTHVHMYGGLSSAKASPKTSSAKSEKKVLVKTHFHWYAMNGGMRNEGVIRSWWPFDLYICSLPFLQVYKGLSMALTKRRLYVI